MGEIRHNEAHSALLPWWVEDHEAHSALLPWVVVPWGAYMPPYHGVTGYNEAHTSPPTMGKRHPWGAYSLPTTLGERHQWGAYSPPRTLGWRRIPCICLPSTPVVILSLGIQPSPPGYTARTARWAWPHYTAAVQDRAYRAKAPCCRTDIPLRASYRQPCYRHRWYCSSLLLRLMSEGHVPAPWGEYCCATLSMPAHCPSLSVMGMTTMCTSPSPSMSSRLTYMRIT